MSDPAETLDELEPDAEPGPRPLQRDRSGKFARGTKGAKAPPPRRRRKASGAGKSLEPDLKAMFVVVATTWHGMESARGHAAPTCGETLGAQAGPIARSLNAVAQEDEAVYRSLSAMLMGGGWGAVAVAAFPVASAVLIAHVLPAMQRRTLELVEPESLEPEVPGRHRAPADEPMMAPEPPWRPPNEIAE